MRLNTNSIEATQNIKAFKAFIDNLKTVGSEVCYKKGDLVFRTNGPADFLIILTKGVLRTFRWVNDKEIVLGFTFPGDMDTSPISFITNTASSDNIDAICDVKGIKVSRTDFFHQLKTLKDTDNFLQTTLLYYMDVLLNRYVDFKAYNAEENYLRLRGKHHKLLDEIPLKDVALFLGISKERLSRIRKKHHLT